MPRPLIQIEDVGKHRIERKQKYMLDEPGRQLLLATYDGRPDTIAMLEKRLMAPRWKIKRWASQLGVTRTRDPRWTKQEEMYLETNLHRMSIRAIAEKLGRSQTAVRSKAVSMGMNKHTDGYTMRSLAQALGCTANAVARWIERGWLKGRRRQTDRLHDVWHFSDKDVRDFIRRHPEEIDQRHVNWLWVVDVLCGGLCELGQDT